MMMIMAPPLSLLPVPELALALVLAAADDDAGLCFVSLVGLPRSLACWGPPGNNPFCMNNEV